jgi:hypothetical protein
VRWRRGPPAAAGGLVGAGWGGWSGCAGGAPNALHTHSTPQGGRPWGPGADRTAACLPAHPAGRCRVQALGGGAADGGCGPALRAPGPAGSRPAAPAGPGPLGPGRPAAPQGSQSLQLLNQGGAAPAGGRVRGAAAERAGPAARGPAGAAAPLQRARQPPGRPAGRPPGGLPLAPQHGHQAAQAAAGAQPGCAGRRGNGAAAAGGWPRLRPLASGNDPPAAPAVCFGVQAVCVCVGGGGARGGGGRADGGLRRAAIYSPRPLLRADPLSAPNPPPTRTAAHASRLQPAPLPP